MSLDDDWDTIRPERHARAIDAGMGLLRLTLLFGSAAVALSLIIIPLVDNSEGRQQIARGGFMGLDTTTTGSISRSNTYTVRRSVLQASPEATCIINGAGQRSGDC